MCDQVVVLLSPEYSASIIGDNDGPSVDTDTGNADRRFTFEVSKRNEQEESAVARPGFKVLRLIPLVVEFLFLIHQRCISVTFHIKRPSYTVQLTQRSLSLVFSPAKPCKAF